MNFQQILRILERKMYTMGRKRAKNKEFVFKKCYSHNFAPIDPILNQNGRTVGFSGTKKYIFGIV